MFNSLIVGIYKNYSDKRLGVCLTPQQFYSTEIYNMGLWEGYTYVNLQTLGFYR
jgi:hypothetical protein